MRRALVPIALLSLCGPAWAQTAVEPGETSGDVDPQRARAVALFKRAQQHYRAGEFRQAVELLNESYALHPAPVLLYNLGRAYESSGDLERALDAYQRYLSSDPKAPDRGAIRQRIATLQRQRDERERLRRKASRKQSSSVAPWVVAGSGVAILGVGTFFGLRARSLHGQAGDEKRALVSEELQRDAEQAATIATVAFVTGGILTAGGVGWGIWAGASGSQGEVALRGAF